MDRKTAKRAYTVRVYLGWKHHEAPWAGFELGFDHWGTFSYPSADAKGIVFLAGFLIGLGRKSQISRDF